jgi:uncharacterized protein YdaU (DUF1376 family)
MHYFPFHIGDYKSHTHHLSMIEDLAYRRLLDHYYLHEVPIKQRDIARQIGMRDNEQEVLSVLDEFFVSTEEGFINPRADKIIASYHEMVAAGKRGAAKRWLNLPDSHPNAHPIATPIPTPIATINHKPKPINTATSVATPDGVSLEVWQEFIKHRKARRATLTPLVIENIKKEAKKAGWSLEDTLKYTIVRGWTSFEADWVKEKNTEQKSTSNIMRSAI